LLRKLSPYEQGRPLADWTDCFQSGSAPKGAPRYASNLRKVILSIEAVCVAGRGAHSFLCVGPVVNKKSK